MERTFEYEKDIGHLTITICEGRESAEIRYQIDNERPLYALGLFDQYDAVRLYAVSTIKGMKVGGFKLENYLEVKAAYDEINSAITTRIENEKSAELNALTTGETKIACAYSDGEYLSGYTVYGQAAELLKGLGLAKDVSGWGTLVDDKAIKALGTEISYPAAVEFARPAIEQEAAKIAEKAAARQAIFDTAKTTGEKQEFRTWSEDCNDPDEDCSMDMVTEWAMPNGSTTTTRSHTW